MIQTAEAFNPGGENPIVVGEFQTYAETERDAMITAAVVFRHFLDVAGIPWRHPPRPEDVE